MLFPRSTVTSKSPTFTTQSHLVTSRNPILMTQTTVFGIGVPGFRGHTAQCDVPESHYGITMFHCDITDCIVISQNFFVTSQSCYIQMTKSLKHTSQAPIPVPHRAPLQRQRSSGMSESHSLISQSLIVMSLRCIVKILILS